AFQPLRLGIAEIFLEVHAGRPGSALAGEHQHAHVVTKLELIDDAQHLSVELRAHAVALLRAIELHPGNSVLDVDGNGIGFSPFAHELSLPLRMPLISRSSRPPGSSVLIPLSSAGAIEHHRPAGDWMRLAERHRIGLWLSP